LDARGRGDKRALLTHLNDAFGWGVAEAQRLQRFRAGLSSFIRADPATLQMLERLAQRYRLGVVTNGSSETQRAKLARLGFEPLFDKIIVSEEVGCRKPDSAIFRLAIAGWDVPASSVLVVGDDPVADVEGARAAGMQALRVRHHDGIASLLMLEEWLEANGTPPAP
jgi:putative hydrolase of the HAD superfamily